MFPIVARVVRPAVLRPTVCLAPPRLAGVAQRAFASGSGKKVAVVLAGAGVADGSEIQEAVFVLSTLSKMGASASCFAPDKPQMHVVNHTSFQPEEGATRNVLQESARIARGAVANLATLKAADFDAVIFPGGFGVAKNLSNFATEGPNLTVDADVARVIGEFHAQKKALGFYCIAPVLAARVLGSGVELTVGSDKEGEDWPYAGAAGAINAVGAKHVVKPLGEAHVDASNKVVSSAAYMCGTAKVHEIEESVAAMVKGTLALA
eukprot:TRINITY_DN75403_c0_g1_i1.p1 TRINITY_DN75403_c0_g1~~TRINITY_DN75403_c0_g1_i1.p1  ORF type:complete len:264 (-),score=63.99 TRINITY_DN75403_c0_g1_i1:49-840(-)